MCIVFWTFQRQPSANCAYKFIFAGNRDEFFDRPTQLTSAWKKDGVKILSPMDLQPDENSRGTWVGVNQLGKVSFLTNFFEPNFKTLGKKSRGLLVIDYLLNPTSSFQALNESDIHCLPKSQKQINSVDCKHQNSTLNPGILQEYDGFNLVQLDLKTMKGHYITNRNEQGSYTELCESVLYGLSNSTLNCWPKVLRGKEEIQKILDKHPSDNDELANSLFQVLELQASFKDELPKLDELYNSIFIPMHPMQSAKTKSEGYYGTRSSCVMLVDKNNVLHCYEKFHSPSYQNILPKFQASESIKKFEMQLDI
ncbi:hypothetical protein BB561_000288 [Smittium simulii]|uniref:Uncharacterized protein n=1 Tax=Smittium simulii TaxID=133385 RepID=A0A2T9YZX8_9FUNG|nr:hypothetical protein BB561_000288 [Smittium simulii]